MRASAADTSAGITQREFHLSARPASNQASKPDNMHLLRCIIHLDDAPDRCWRTATHPHHSRQMSACA